MMTRTKKQGFTLIELMIAVVIISILSAIAIPSYQAHVKTANRSQAQAGLIQAAAALEQYRNNNDTYLNATIDSTNNSIFPYQVPAGSNSPLYQLNISAQASDSYTLQAIPIAGSSAAGDLSFSLNSTGLKQNCAANCGTANNWSNGW